MPTTWHSHPQKFTLTLPMSSGHSVQFVGGLRPQSLFCFSGEDWYCYSLLWNNIAVWEAGRNAVKELVLSASRLMVVDKNGNKIWRHLRNCKCVKKSLPMKEGSHVMTDGWSSVSMSWLRAHCGTCGQILILSEFCCLAYVGRPLWREVGSVSCRSLSAVIVHRQVFFTRHVFVYTIYARRSQSRLSTADHALSFVTYTTTAV
jgi:hypothetical protein